MSDSGSDERRPRPIGGEEGEESDDESDTENSNAKRPSVGNNTADGNQSAGGAAGPAGVAALEGETTKKKVARKTPAFSENNLVMEKGLIKVYKEFPQKCQYKGRGREVWQRCFFM